MIIICMTGMKKMRDTDFTVLSMQDVRFKMQKMILN